MAVNPMGAVWTNDFGTPKILTGYAMVAITGGQLVQASGTGNTVGSGLDQFNTGSLTFNSAASGNFFTGVALTTAASGALLPVAVEGVFILSASQAVTNGGAVQAAGSDGVGDAVNANGINAAGRALTGAASGTNNFALVYIK